MYNKKDLKKNIEITDIQVECPVKGCNFKIPRQKKSFKATSEFQCPKHKIYISQTTFEYYTEQDNLLWYQSDDKFRFDNIKKVKRESRIARDNSEDALTWNVFRFLERENILCNYLKELSQRIINTSELILWSYSANENNSWSWLNKARLEFGETIARGSEPDIIIVTDKVLYFIEAKLTASNITPPSNSFNRKKYETGGGQYFTKVFNSSYTTIAIDEKRYELMRFWLIGSWLAEQLNLDFELVSLLREKNETELESDFSKHLKLSIKRKYYRTNWENIYDFILKLPDTESKKTICGYLKNKTIGYSLGQLINAFNIND